MRLRAYAALVLFSAVAVTFYGCGRVDPSTMPSQAAMDMAGPHEGLGPGEGGDKYDRIVENDFVAVATDPRSTFSIDVDTTSYAKVREFLKEHHMMPPVDAVRIEEFINYFTYEYAEPTDDRPFAVHADVAGCPWRPDHRLVRIALQGKRIDQTQRPASNLVFLLDVSGSMSAGDKLPLVLEGMEMLVEQLNQNDRVAIVVYAGAAGVVLDSTSCDRKQDIIDALRRLHAGGSTAGGAGIRLAYQTARDHLIEGGTNRVILCTDGDFNVGTTSTGDLVRLAEEQAKSGVFLSVLGFGTGNLNDAMLEQISNRADGNYAFIDTASEARKVLVEEMTGTLLTIAKDVKIQVEFNPQEVQAWRLIGYENRIMAHQDFNDDRKDAGEIGAGHNVTALYEVVPVGVQSDVVAAATNELKYQRPTKPSEAAGGGELLTVSLRYKLPEADQSELLTVPVTDSGTDFEHAGRDFQHAAAVALFGMLLRDSAYKGEATFEDVVAIATRTAEGDELGYRKEFVELARLASGCQRQ